MKRIKNFGLGLSVIFILASCSQRLTPFTQEMYDRADWSENDLKRIQFYLSEDILLFRSLSKGESVISNGKIRIRDGKRVEEVVIRSGTPGLLVFIPKENRFAVSFEEGPESPYLMFGPNPKIDNRYALLAREWEKYQGKVTYNGQKYNVNSNSAYATLLVDMDRVGQTEYKKKVAAGRTIKG